MARRKGSKALKKSGDKLINQYGVEFTKDEQKILQRLVARNSYRRNQMIDMFKDVPFVDEGGRKTNETFKDRMERGFEGDFILSKKTSSLQNFESREYFNRYIKNLERVTQKDYIPQRLELYRENYIKALETMDIDNRDIIEQIRKMDSKEFLMNITANDTMTIDYVYSFVERLLKQGRIKDTLKELSKPSRKGGRRRRKR